MADAPVHLIIDGRQVEVPRGTLVIEAAKQAGIEVPIFCYHPKLKPVGACRMCLVDIQKMPRLQTACTTPVAEGMIVHTRNDRARAAQKGVIELLLVNHPLDCPICDKGGECPLQDNTFKFGLGTSRFGEPKRKLAKALPLSDRVVLDRERCIMCYRCVRFQDEIAGDQALAAIDRAGMTQIGVLEGETFDSPFSGNTIDLCPVGALLSRQYRFRARPWDLERMPSVCVGCAVGCNVELHAREQALQRMIPRENMAVNNEWLCDFGRFETLPLGIERVRQPLVHGAPVSWQEALQAAADLVSSAGWKPARGQDGHATSIEIVASPSLTNEALNALRRLAADLQAPLGVWPARTGRVRGSIEDLVASKTIILLDFDVWTELPVLALRIREALARGGQLFFAGSGANGLRRDTAASYASADVLAHALGSPAGPISILGRGADELAQRVEATGMVGEPATAANGYAMADLPEARFAPATLLLAGNENWPDLTGKKLVSLRWSPHPSPLPGGEGIVLPLTHPYEQSGSVTNLEGRVQQLRAGGGIAGEARPDWQALADLARALGLSPVEEERQAALA
ncbi:MAG TPA: 2Fe-2S iron-sulfur cluster-binding protein [Chloroflexota bacterium]|nr:2Fe-2S iron-sulfur cluster-binding protein [Chloroflexota bacterium]